MTEEINILIVDDHAIVREGQRALIDTEPGMTLVGEATNGAEAIELALTRQLPLIIDERKGRKIARQKNLSIIGLAGLIILAAKRQHKTPKAALELLDKALLSGFRLSSKLYQQVKEALVEIENEVI